MLENDTDNPTPARSVCVLNHASSTLWCLCWVYFGYWCLVISKQLLVTIFLWSGCRSTLNKEIKALEQHLQTLVFHEKQNLSAVQNPIMLGNSYAPGGHGFGQQNGFCTPTNAAADYYNPAATRLTGNFSGTGTNGYVGGGAGNFPQPSFPPTSWENNSNGTYDILSTSSFDSLGPRVGLQMQSGPPQFSEVNYSEGSSDPQWCKKDFPWTRKLEVCAKQ